MGHVGNPTFNKFNLQGFLINGLQKTASQLVGHFHRRTHNLINLILQNQFAFIRGFSLRYSRPRSSSCRCRRRPPPLRPVCAGPACMTVLSGIHKVFTGNEHLVEMFSLATRDNISTTISTKLWRHDAEKPFIFHITQTIILCAPDKSDRRVDLLARRR